VYLYVIVYNLKLLSVCIESRGQLTPATLAGVSGQGQPAGERPFRFGVWWGADVTGPIGSHLWFLV